MFVLIVFHHHLFHFLSYFSFCSFICDFCFIVFMSSKIYFIFSWLNVSAFFISLLIFFICITSSNFCLICSTSFSFNSICSSIDFLFNRKNLRFFLLNKKRNFKSKIPLFHIHPLTYNIPQSLLK